MKIVFFGYDFSADILKRLREDGHEILSVFSFETDNVFSFNTRLEELAKELAAPFEVAPITPEQVAELISQGAQCFISAGYPCKIPPIDESRAYGLNLHPTLLPEGRGFMPMPRLIMAHPEACGITIHKLAQEYDRGDILYQEAIKMLPDEDIETLSARMVMRAPHIVSEVVSGIENLWEKAKPQTKKGSWWNAVPDSARTFDWTKTAEETDKMIRAFSRYGMLADFDGRRWSVFQAKSWKEDHDFKPGDIACCLSREVVLAIADGFVVLKEFYPLEQENQA